MPDGYGKRISYIQRGLSHEEPAKQGGREDMRED